MALSKRLRFEILRRDNHACRYCGAGAPEVNLTVDHVVPSALGGSDEPDNLVAACRDCNSGKTSVPADAAVVEDVRQDAVRWARAMERAAVVQGEKEALQSSLFAVAVAWWEENDNWSNVGSRSWMGRPNDWASTIRGFLSQGFTPEALVANAETAYGNARVPMNQIWRYFCGICWRQLRERQEIAHALLADEEAGQ